MSARAAHPESRPASFEAGTAAVQITPTRAELEELKSGFVDKPLFPQGAVQPLWAKALATRSPECALLLVTADLHSTPTWMSDQVRSELSRACAIPRQAVSICTSQNHSSPWAYPEKSSYSIRLIREMVKVGLSAFKSMGPARVGVTKGNAPGIAYNSRLPITEETPPQVCPDRDRHRGGLMFARDHLLGRSGGRPIDHEVGVIRIDGGGDTPMAVVYHYGCHPATVIEGPSMHGDFPGFASQLIEERVPGATAFFLQGCLGNTHPRYFFTDVAGARKNGLELGEEVLRVLPGISTTGEVSSAFAAERFPLSFVPFPRDRLERLLGYFRAYQEALEAHPDACWIGAGPDTINLPPRYSAAARRGMVAPLIAYCESKLAEPASGGQAGLEPLDTEIQVFRWNDIVLCLSSFEMFVQTGLEIKRRSPCRYTFPVGNANTVIGYVAPEEEFALGGYEVVTNPMYGGLPGMRAPQNCDRIISRFMALLQGSAP